MARPAARFALCETERLSSSHRIFTPDSAGHRVENEVRRVSLQPRNPGLRGVLAEAATSRHRPDPAGLPGVAFLGSLSLVQDSTGMLSSCWELVEAAASDDRVQRSALYARYEPVVRAFFCARWGLDGRHDRVRAAVQETFFELFRPGSPSDHNAYDASFRDYLLEVVRETAPPFEERAAEAAQHDLAAQLTVENDAVVLHAFDRAWARSLVRQAGALQRERASEHRGGAMLRCQLIEMRFNEGLSLGAAGAKMGLQGETLRTAYAKAGREFAAALREVIREHDPSRPAEVDRTCKNIGRLLN